MIMIRVRIPRCAPRAESCWGFTRSRSGSRSRTFVSSLRGLRRIRSPPVSAITTLLYSSLLYSTLLYSILLYTTLLYSARLYSTLLCSNLLYCQTYRAAERGRVLRVFDKRKRLLYLYIRSVFIYRFFK